MKNMRSKKIASAFNRCLSFTGVLLLAGCAGKGASGGTVEQLSDAPVDCSEAVEVIISSEEGVQDTLLQESFSEKKGERNEKTYYEVDVCRRNEESGFYTVSYGEDMTQFTFLNQIYHVNLETKAEEMLYETREAYWLNEFEATDGFLYWVEYIWTEAEEESCGTVYRIMQYELATGEVRCIAERDSEEVLEICLAVSEQYVTWYDDYQEGRTEIVIYDIERQKFRTLPGVKKFSAYARLDIVDGGITYFCEDEKGNISVNRYVLDSGKTDVLMLGKMNASEELLFCFSTDRYMGWQTDCGAVKGDCYYFYDRESGVLYSFREDKGINVFSAWISDYLYLNCYDSEGYTLYVCDLPGGSTWQEDMEGYGMQFREYGDGQVYLEVRMKDEVKLMTIAVPEQLIFNE